MQRCVARVIRYHRSPGRSVLLPSQVSRHSRTLPWCVDGAGFHFITARAQPLVLPTSYFSGASDKLHCIATVTFRSVQGREKAVMGLTQI